jgi:hypothetical protein
MGIAKVFGREEDEAIPEAIEIKVDVLDRFVVSAVIPFGVLNVTDRYAEFDLIEDVDAQS